MKIQVQVNKKWGRYKKGDKLEMHPSTAKTIAAKGFIKILAGQEVTQEEVQEKVQKKTAKENLKQGLDKK